MEPAGEYWFNHEKLEVYQESIRFVGWLSELLDSSSRLGDIKDQLDRASNSIVLSTAEGNGKYSERNSSHPYFQAAEPTEPAAE
jgi:four helix bundle protein